MPNTKTVVPYSGTPEQEAQLKAVIAEYKDVPGGTMPVMQQAQEIFGYLPEEVQIMIAEGMGIPLEEVYGISTFYSLYNLNPKGQYKITVCLGTACYVKGSQAILDKVVASDVPTFGFDAAKEDFCDMIAAGIIDPTKVCRSALEIVNDDVYGRMTPDQVDDVLAKYK